MNRKFNRPIEIMGMMLASGVTIRKTPRSGVKVSHRCGSGNSEKRGTWSGGVATASERGPHGWATPQSRSPTTVRCPTHCCRVVLWGQCLQLADSGHPVPKPEGRHPRRPPNRLSATGLMLDTSFTNRHSSCGRWCPLYSTIAVQSPERDVQFRDGLHCFASPVHWSENHSAARR